MDLTLKEKFFILAYDPDKGKNLAGMIDLKLLTISRQAQLLLTYKHPPASTN